MATFFSARAETNLILFGSDVALVAKPSEKAPQSLSELVALPPNKLETLDVAVVNLLCAEGLRGAEDVDVSKCVSALDDWARRVQFETERHYYRFTRNPELFCKSLAYYRMQMLGDVLVNDLRMRYNPERAHQSDKGLNSREDQDAFFSNAKDIFVHGLIDGDRYGTCASMPFLYVAIARRLGYPVNLAATDEHLYVRYEEANGEHLNIEATAVSRFKTPPDEYYKEHWDRPVTDARAKAGGWLRPLSNKEILGHCLFTRAACLRSMKRHDEMAKTLELAARYLPDTPEWKQTIKNLQDRAKADSQADQWNTLWAQIEQIDIPPGPGYVYFRDRKIKLHLLMNNGAALSVIEAALAEFQKELGEHVKPLIERSTLVALPNKADKERKITAACFKFQDSGKEVCVAEDLLPPTARGRIPPPMVDFILNNKLDSEAAILTYLWNDYEERVLSRQKSTHAQMDALMADATKPVLIAREQVPMEYWNGIPPALETRLTGLRDPKAIVGEINAFHSERQALQREREERERRAARERALAVMRRAGISTHQAPANGLHRRANGAEGAEFGSPQAFSGAVTMGNDIPEIYREWITPQVAERLNRNDLWMLQQEEKHRQAEKQIEALQHLRTETSTPPAHLPFRLVPAAVLSGQAVMQPSTIPKLDEASSDALNRTTIGKGTQ